MAPAGPETRYCRGNWSAKKPALGTDGGASLLEGVSPGSWGE